MIYCQILLETNYKKFFCKARENCPQLSSKYGELDDLF